MLLPMPPTDSMFLLAESREHPMHVGGLQLFTPPDGADAMDVRALFDAAMAENEVAPVYLRRPRRSVASAGQWGWEDDDDFDIEHHVRRNALPRPGRVLELLALCSRLHSTLLDRHRPLWETHLIEGLDDGRYAVYFKVHHSLMDGVSALRMLQTSLSSDPDQRDMKAPWGPRPARPRPDRQGPGRLANPVGTARTALGLVGETAGLAPALVRTVSSAIREQASAVSFSAPRSMLNVPITGARRFAAQSWPISRFRQIAKAADATLNDVVLAQCSGALRTYLLDLEALPDSSLIAMVPVSLRPAGDDGGNAVGVTMCNLGTDHADPAQRLSTVHRSMQEGKALLSGMTPMQILAMSAIGMSPLVLNPLLHVGAGLRPPFNLVISNVPGPREAMYWNGARLDGLYPLSIPLDGQALNITVTTYSGEVAFGLIGCRRSVPRLQRLLTHLDEELSALEQAVGVS